MSNATTFNAAVPTHILKSVVSCWLPFFHRICNQSLTEGVFPELYKTAIVNPTLKKENLDPELLQNYRPVSNIDFISKFLERVVEKQLSEYLESNVLLNDKQSAYRRGFSTETALLTTSMNVLNQIDKNNNVLLASLDLQAAFDTIDHVVLLRVSATLWHKWCRFEMDWKLLIWKNTAGVYWKLSFKVRGLQSWSSARFNSWPSVFQYVSYTILRLLEHTETGLSTLCWWYSIGFWLQKRRQAHYRVKLIWYLWLVQ